ncbi:hypothetical protein ACIPZF_11395 [Pseudomonas sp. NPDC089752]|uniref:Tc toxin subunit A-related protein n=1 Tax=Pseudomonas sp. NPDC089752 TaxID=3364472 RepID=UPI0038299FA7
MLKRVDESPISDEAVKRLIDMFEPKGKELKLQFRLPASEYGLESVKPDDDNDPFLSLEVVLGDKVDTGAKDDGEPSNYALHVRGISAEVVERKRPLAIQIIFEAKSAAETHYFSILSHQQGVIEFRCSVKAPPVFGVVALYHGELNLIELSREDFAAEPYGWYAATTLLDLDPLLDVLVGYSPIEVREGAGFSVQIDRETIDAYPIAENFITYRSDLAAPQSMQLRVNDEPAWDGVVTASGGGASPWIQRSVTLGQPVTVKFGKPDELSMFTVSTLLQENLLFKSIVPYISHQSGTDFLVFESIQVKGKPLVARLNSQQIPDLINRAQASPWAVFAWDAQHLQEPPYVPESPSTWRRTVDDPLMNMFDANGLYLRELFFHVPHLIASRLQEEQRFEEARRWLGMIFNPQSRHPETEHSGIDYWNCAWILQDDNTQAAGLEHQLIDPHVIALHAPSHYRKAIFIQYVYLLLGDADVHYRRQTRDSLANAWLLYRMAAELLGEAPNARAIDTWQPRTVEDLIKESDDQSFARYASSVSPADLPKQLSTFVWTGVAAHRAFRLPVNQQLLDTWALLEQRIHNLRHYLTIDGNPLQLALYEPAVDPLELLMARMGGNANMSHLLGSSTVVPPYRFRTLVAKAQEAVAALIQFGEQLRSYMELEDRSHLEMLQYQHAAELGGFTIEIQKELYEQQKKNEVALCEQKCLVQARLTHFQELDQEGVSVGETFAMALHGAGRLIGTVTGGVMAASHFASVVPNIFGLANGGSNYAGPLQAAGALLNVGETALLTAGEILRETEGYRRRAQDWKLQIDLATKELAVIDKQLEAQKHATLAAQQSCQHSATVLKQTKEIYEFYKKKTASVSLYQWLRSQTATLHATLFDVAVSLCNSAETCWQFETGNYGRRIIRAPAWQADRYGLDAGSKLKLDLLRLEAEVLMRHERHLEVRKTVSLLALLDENLVFNKGNVPLATWPEVVEALSEDGELSFQLSEELFNKDYPGHYMRRLHSVALSLPALLGPYQNIRATLAQQKSQLLTAPDIEGVKHLSPRARAAENGNGLNVMMSLRTDQKVCVSSANQDLGMFVATEPDDRYRPFENTGAVSSWRLRFPRHAKQSRMLESLSDIIIEVQYFALYGGEKFEGEVMELLRAGEESLRLPPS